MGVRPEKELRQPTDAAVAAAAGENDDRSFPAGEARVGEGSAARSDDMLQGDTEIAGEGVAVAKAAMASDGERRREAEEGERLRLERWWHHRPDHHLPPPDCEHPAADREVSKKEEGQWRSHRQYFHPLPDASAVPNGRMGRVV